MMATVFDLDDAIPLTGAEEILPQLPERLAVGKGAVSLTSHGKPVLVVMTWELFESLCETIEIMSAPDLMAGINAEQEQDAPSQAITLDELKARLEL